MSTGTRALQPGPVSADADFRVMTEFDAVHSELFLARAVVLVESLTEKLVLPFVFSTLRYDVDREAVSIVRMAELAASFVRPAPEARR